jgi:hypothetical protein
VAVSCGGRLFCYLLAAGSPTRRPAVVDSRSLSASVEIAGNHNPDCLNPTGHFTNSIEAAFRDRGIGIVLTPLAGSRSAKTVGVVKPKILQPFVILRERTAHGAECWPIPAMVTGVLVAAAASSPLSSTSIARLFSLGIPASPRWFLRLGARRHVAGGSWLGLPFFVRGSVGFTLRLRPATPPSTPAATAWSALITVVVCSTTVFRIDRLQRFPRDWIDGLDLGLVVLFGKRFLIGEATIFSIGGRGLPVTVVGILSRTPATPPAASASPRLLTSIEPRILSVLFTITVVGCILLKRALQLFSGICQAAFRGLLISPTPRSPAAAPPAAAAFSGAIFRVVDRWIGVTSSARSGRFIAVIVSHQIGFLNPTSRLLTVLCRSGGRGRTGHWPAWLCIPKLGTAREFFSEIVGVGLRSIRCRPRIVHGQRLWSGLLRCIPGGIAAGRAGPDRLRPRVCPAVSFFGPKAAAAGFWLLRDRPRRRPSVAMGRSWIGLEAEFTCHGTPVSLRRGRGWPPGRYGGGS